MLRIERLVAMVCIGVIVASACESDPVNQPPEGDVKLPMELTLAREAAEATDSTLNNWLAANTERFYGAFIPDSAFDIISAGIGTRRIVMLGAEAGLLEHQSSLRTSIVRALHEKRGFNVLAIDGPIWQCAPQLNPALGYQQRKLQESCTTSEWNDDEIAELFRYVESTQRTKTPLVVVGLSAAGGAEQPSSTSMPSLVARYDRAYAARVQELDSVFSALMKQSLEKPIGERKPVPFSVSLQFDSLSDWFTRTQQRESMTVEDAARYALAAAAARTSADVARVSGTFTRKMHEAIDDIIAENLVFVADSLYQSQRIIVWSQNDRIVRNKPPDRAYGESTSGMAAAFERASPQNTPYSIALFGVSGDKLYQRQARVLPPSPNVGLAQLLYDKMGRTVLLTANATTNSGATAGAPSRDRSTRSAGNSRITTLRAMEKYDAVLVISSVSAVTPTPK